MAEFEPSSRNAPNHINHYKHRANYDEETVYRIIDENLVCFVSFRTPEDDVGAVRAEDIWPFVLPMAFGRLDDRIFLHGHLNSRLLKALSEPGTRACVNFTSVQGYVLARSVFHNDFNYRSAIVLGNASLVADGARKVEALTAITNHAFKNLPTGPADRWADSRAASEVELKSTRVVEIAIETASAKIADDGPIDERSDIEDPTVRNNVWAGKLMRKSVWEMVGGTAEGVTKKIPEYVDEFLKHGHD